MEPTDKACYLNDSSFKSTKPEIENTELVVNMESNGNKNVIDNTTSKNMTKSEESFVPPDLTAHDSNLQFLKHLDDLKSDEVKNNDSEKIVQEVLSDAEKLVQVQNAFSLRMKIKNNSLMVK